CICDGLVTNTLEVEEISRVTLFKPLRSAEDVLCDLVKNRFLIVDEEKTEDQSSPSLLPTQLGRATLVSALPPDAALFVFSDLLQATKAIVLDTELHMLYLVTPANSSVWQGCDWNHLLTIFSKLKSEEKRVAKLVGANDGFLLSRLRGASVANYDRNYQLHLRFFSALALFDVINEKPIDQVAARFRISRGTLQTLQQQSATYAAMVVAFCSRLGWTYLHDLLRSFAARLAFGVRRELTELVSIDGLDATRARIFHDHGITSFAQLSNCTTKKIAEILSLAVPFNSDNSADGLNEWLFGEARMRLEEAAELVKERASNSVKEHLRSLGLNVDCVNQLSQSVRTLSSPQEDDSKRRSAVSLVDESEKLTASNVPEDPTNKALSPVVSEITWRSVAQETENSISDKAELTDSILEENSVDLFSESMEELTIDDNLSSRRLSAANKEEQFEEVDDLESSLLKVSMICDKENQEPNSAYDLPDSFANSPSCASPLGKASRLDRVSTAATELEINDVCRSESAWNYFIQRSSLWTKVGVALATKRHDSAEQNVVHGISFCTSEGAPHYIPLSEEYFPGNETEEALCPSFTPSQSIALEERISCVASILKSCEVSLIDALRDCCLVWNALKLKISQPLCVCYTAFLSHLRAGERPLAIREIVAKFRWDFDIVNNICLGGFFFDVGLCSSLVQKLKKKTEHLERECFELAGRSFNLDSPSQVAEVLFSRLNLSYPGGKTSKKHMSTGKSVLEQMRMQHPIVDNILLYRRLRHAIGTTPKDTLIDGIGLRHLFRAQEGCVLVNADYSQLELRVLAQLSGDSSLITHLSSGRDIFAELSTKWQVSRDTVKKLCYGIIYGMGCKTLSESIKKTVEEGNELMQSFFKSFPKVRTYINSTKEKAVTTGFVSTFLGRRRVACSVRGRQEDVARDDRQSINYTIQGTASEIFKKALVRLDETKQDLHDADLHVTMVDASFKLRNVLCEYSLALPSAVNRSLYPDLRLQVPTFHIFGITPEGKKACVHVHGFLPYMLLRVGGNFTPTLEQRMREKINRMIQREFITNPEQLEKQTTDNYVYRIVPMMAKSIYGYHEEMEQFVKIVFLNPMHRARLFTALAKEVDEFPVMQPFEAHTPFTLQFFIDNSIFGMDEIVFNRVQYRIGHQRDSQEIVFGNFTVADIMNDVSLLSPAPPITSCAVECDALASNIMNKQLHSSNVHSCNPGLEYIWREEATRCSAQGRKLEDTFNNYTPRPYWRNKAETDLLSQLEEVSRIIRANGAATQKDYTQPSEDPVVPEHLLIDNEEELDSTIAWTQDLTAISSENSKAEEEPKGEEEQEGSDEEDIEDNIAAEEEIMKTQIMDNMNKGQDYKEDQADAIEDLFGEDGSPTKPCKRFVDSCEGALLEKPQHLVRPTSQSLFRTQASDRIDSFKKVCNEHLMMVPDERSLFEKLVELVKKSDPDIFFGYDTVRLSWGYILKRAPVIGFFGLPFKPWTLSESYVVKFAFFRLTWVYE
ncbi:DNA-directed DNA polymerase, partial [Necator americanus]